MRISNMLSRLSGLASALLIPIAAFGTDPESLAGDEFSNTLVKVGDIYVAGQPTETGLETAQAMGVETIVSLRTPAEMEDSTEPDQAAQLGMDFVSIPSGGADHPYSPAEVDAFARVMESAQGPVLLHCRSGTRATHLYVAWLVRHRDVPLEDALRIGRQIEFGQNPLEGYLDGNIEYRFKDQ